MTELTRPKLFYLRIAFSAVCGLLCVLLIILWVRSYRICDSAPFGITSVKGKVYFGSVQVYVEHDLSIPLDVSYLPAADVEVVSTSLPGSQPAITVHYWIPTVVFAMLSVLPWFPHTRFSLRTLLIATTVLAVILGLMVWALNT